VTGNLATGRDFPADDAHAEPVDRQFSISLSRGLALLRAFTANDSVLSHRELCERTGLAKATVSRLTYTLASLGYLSRTPDQRYALAAGVLALAHPMLAGMRIRQLARPWMHRLAAETGTTVNLGVIDRLSVLYVDTCRTDPRNPFSPDIGTTAPILATAIGRALLLGLRAAERTSLINRLRVADPAQHALDSRLWHRDREAFTARRFCSSRSDWRPGIHAVAAALSQTVHPGVVAINCTWWAARTEPAPRMARMGARLLEAIAGIERACLEARLHPGAASV
jgi:DNA-binding IclR family transcriptional regulator